MVGVHSNQDRYIKITPTIDGGVETREPITQLTAETDDSTIMSASITDSGLIKTRFKKPGRVNLTVTAINEDTGNQITCEFTFVVVTTTDVIDVITGTAEPNNYNTGSGATVKNSYLNNVSFKVKDIYKDFVKLSVGSGHSQEMDDLTVTEQNGVITVEHTTLRYNSPSTYFQLLSKDDQNQIGGVLVQFYPDAEENYPLTSADMTVTGYYGDDKRDGETLNLDFAFWEGKDIQCRFGINPGALRNAASVITEVTSSNTEVAVVGPDATYLNNDRQIPVNIIGTGTTELTLHVTDGLEYDETATITVVVS